MRHFRNKRLRARRISMWATRATWQFNSQFIGCTLAINTKLHPHARLIFLLKNLQARA